MSKHEGELRSKEPLLIGNKSRLAGYQAGKLTVWKQALEKGATAAVKWYW